MGARINRRFDGLFSVLHVKSAKPGDTIFYWNVETEPQRYDDFRVPSSDDKTRRNLEHIPPVEIASAVKFVLTRQIGLSKEDLEREVSRIFRFARCTESMQIYIRAGLEIAVNEEVGGC